MVVIVIALSLVAVTVPTAIYASALCWFDRYEREPLSLLAVAFGWGAFPAIILAVLGSFIGEIPLYLLGANSDLISASTVAPVVEEVTKGFIVFILYWGFHNEFDGPLDGIIYGAIVGYGFAMVENLLYLGGAWAEGGWSSWLGVLFLRTIVFGLNHAFFTSLTGLGFGLARLNRSPVWRVLLPLMGLGAAISFHGLHNLGASLVDVNCLTLVVSLMSDWGGILIIFVAILLSVNQEKHWLMEELKEEVAAGLITPEEYTMSCSQRARWLVQANALGQGKLSRALQISRFVHLISELAFKKHQVRTRGDNYIREIDKLRDQIMIVRAQL